MFKHILVPLDGSTLAEAVLPVVRTLAIALRARVTLLHIVEADAPDTVHREHHLSKPDEAARYLEETARRCLSQALAVECHVHVVPSEDVTRSIVEHQAELAPDLIVMCAHGRSGYRRWRWGTIAQQVVATGRVPVLLVRPGKGGTVGDFACRRFLVPLDGSAEHEEGLRVAADLAEATGAMLCLVLIVPTPGTLAGAYAAVGRLMPHATRTVLDLAHRDGQEYLASIAARLQTRGLKVEVETVRGSVAAGVAAAARRTPPDMVIQATHGSAGTRAFWRGSLTPMLLARIPQPFLLVPVPPA